MAHLRTVRDKIIVKLDPYIGISDGGIVMSDQSETTPVTGVVVAIGSDVSTLSPSDRVHCKRYAGTIFTVDNDDNKYCSIREREIEATCDADWYYDFKTFRIW
jgi:co-chaperonin GroES (HSP10)